MYTPNINTHLFPPPIIITPKKTQVYITVRATDNGRPPLDDVCTFKVSIEDINDNPPVFDKARYDESMSEDTVVDRVIMRISASDLDDGNNSMVEYELLPEKDAAYFRINKNNGQIYLNRPIDKKPGHVYSINVRAYNVIPEAPQDAQIEVRIKIIESNKKPPTFITKSKTITLQENFHDFGKHLVTLEAVSNVPDKPDVIFELKTGRTEQTNSKKTFVFNQNGETAYILLGKPLDYETITEYTLSMGVKNTWDLESEVIVKIKVEDVNDNIPYFTEVTTGSVSENEPPGTPVMQVRAFDMDGTSANNIVSFRLEDNTEFFTIDAVTGNITALKTLDREERDFYNVKVIASDNSPSALYETNTPNQGQQVFRIEIADKNDHPPYFQKKEYLADELPEDANVNSVVIEVTADDKDAASKITYTIVSGNTNDAFKIERSTGTIKVNSALDYETTTEYNLTVRAFDDIYEDYATVTIRIKNVNDNVPVFTQSKYNTTITEEQTIPGCMLRVEAYDPDIADRDLPQNMKYFIVKEQQQSLLEIDRSGCVHLIKPLDRDEPNGHKKWQIIIQAADEDGNGLRSTTEVTITLLDINDNAPFLVNRMPVVWYENQLPDRIVQLQSKDYDEPQNGPPFTYEIAETASEVIQTRFGVEDDYLIARVSFDREEQKEYWIPIRITDSGNAPQSNISLLHLIIGDVNDNAMESGQSAVFVYNYRGEAPDTEIGRVYVKDLDDWDLPDKSFEWKDDVRDDRFELAADTGMITMLRGTKQDNYTLYFTVWEESARISRHSVIAEVVVTVRELPEEAVDKSGSIRFVGTTAEEFVESPDASGPSKKDILRTTVARMLNASVENVDVFTVLRQSNASVLDVRFSAHGSPFYEPERINGRLAMHQAELESALGMRVLMINIDECLVERVHCEGVGSCSNVLHKSSVPAQVFTNRTSFVGVNAFVQAECVCQSTAAAVPQLSCLNGGTPADEDRCECAEGFEGPRCELLGIGFYGDGWAMYPPVNPCEQTFISLELTPQQDRGLVLYIGPHAFNEALNISDFLALELVRGIAVLTVDYGSGAVTVDYPHQQMVAGQTYQIRIELQRKNIELKVGNCNLSRCSSMKEPIGANQYLNVNSPLMLGGATVNLSYLGSRFHWAHTPQQTGFSGCVRNLTVNGQTYNLGTPALSRKADSGCHRSMAVMAVSFSIDSNFIIAIVGCIAVLVILLLTVVVYKRRHDGWPEKDMDDIRETIINYEDEGGGERDTDFDLNVLRSPPFYDEKPLPGGQQMLKDQMLMQQQGVGVGPNGGVGVGGVPDIGGFLVDKKDSCDKDSEAHPFDDVRHYAYEGDGNSTRSLSSLASGTDEGDLNFDHLPTFGPRFRKLADMYGEDPSDDDSTGGADVDWQI